MITKVSCMQVSTQALGTQGVVGSPALMEHSWQGARHPLGGEILPSSSQKKGEKSQSQTCLQREFWQGSSDSCFLPYSLCPQGCRDRISAEAEDGRVRSRTRRDTHCLEGFTEEVRPLISESSVLCSRKSRGSRGSVS